MNYLYGIKLNQSQDFDDTGHRVPVTWIKVEPMWVVSKKTPEKNNYSAVQVAFGTRKHPNKPLLGLLKNLPEKITPKFLKELKTSDEDSKNIGDKVIVSDVFTPGDTVKVTGTSKGKGFAGVVKRHGFKGGPKTHGQSRSQRHPGSIGAGTTPGRIYKGKRMAGHMGAVTRTVKNLKVFKVLPEENLLIVTGLVPGNKNSLVTVTKDA